MRRFVLIALFLFSPGMPFEPRASADTIAKFNEAIRSGDVKSAVQVAAAVWPSLDRSREDFGLIATEFGYAAYRAGEMAATRTYAAAAIETSASGQEQQRAVALVLLRAAELKIASSPASRAALATALNQRMNLGNADFISITAAIALTDHDLNEGAWTDLQQSARMGVAFTTADDFRVLVANRQFQLRTLAADFLVAKEALPENGFELLAQRLRDDIDAVGSDAMAELFVEMFWDARAWAAATASSDPKKRSSGSVDSRPPYDPELRSTRLLFRKDPGNCRLTPVVSTFPVLVPRNGRYRGILGAVVLRMDIDSKGNAENIRALSAVPERTASPELLRHARNIRFKKGDVWDKNTCQFERKDHVVTVIFRVGT